MGTIREPSLPHYRLGAVALGNHNLPDGQEGGHHVKYQRHTHTHKHRDTLIDRSKAGLTKRANKHWH